MRWYALRHIKGFTDRRSRSSVIKVLTLFLRVSVKAGFSNIDRTKSEKASWLEGRLGLLSDSVILEFTGYWAPGHVECKLDPSTLGETPTAPGKE